MSRPVQSITLIVPFYNEEETVPHLAKRLYPVVGRLQSRFRVELLLVDDGSTDDTYTLLTDCFTGARFPDATILRHVHNRGIGAAMATGFEVATGDVVCTLDSDCTYAPERVEDLIDLLIKHNADIVTGSPYHPDGGVDNVPEWRLFLSKSASVLYSLICPAKLYCYTSFFRAYRREWVRTDLFEAEGFLGVAEMLVNASFENARIIECPARLGLRVYGQSKMRVASVTAQHLRLMVATLFTRTLHPKSAADPVVEAVPRRLAGTMESIADRPEEFSKLLDRWVLVGRVRVEG